MTEILLSDVEKKCLHFISSSSLEQKATKYLFGSTYRDSYEEKEVDLAIKDGADVNAKDRHERSVLHLAVERDNLKMVKKLLNQPNIIVNCYDKFGQTPLHYAVGNVSSLSIPYILWEAGVEVNSEDNYHRTALDVCDDNGGLKMENFLKKIGGKRSGYDWDLYYEDD